MDHVQGSLYSMFVVVVGNFWDLVSCSPGWNELLPPSAKPNLTGVQHHIQLQILITLLLFLCEKARGPCWVSCLIAVHFILRERSLPEPGAHWPAGLSDQWASGNCLCPSTGVRGVCSCNQCFCGCWGPAIEFHVFAASILLNGLSTHFPGIFLLDHFIE